MVNEQLQKVLEKLNVTAKIREIPGVLAKGSIAARCWRVVLARPIKGEEKPKSLSVVYFAPSDEGEPKLPEVVESLAKGVIAGEQTLWDFATTNGMSVKGDAERIHKVCKRIGPRVKKFFGDSWKNVAPKQAA